MNGRGGRIRRSLGVLRLVLPVGGIAAMLLAAPAQVSDAQTRGGRIVFAARQDIDTLDPLLTARAATRKILIQLLDTLVVISPQDGKISPGLAESWDVSADARTYTFRLRKNVKFHDGTPLDAAAVKFTFDRVLEARSAGGIFRAFLGPYDSSEVVDSHTVRVKFKRPYAPFLRMLALNVLGPVSPAAVQKMGPEFGRRVIGTGPFMVKEWVTQSHVTLVRNPNYNWAPPTAKHQGPAYVDEVVWKFVLEASTRTAILQTGEVNVAEDLSYADVAGLERNSDIRILRSVPAGTPWAILPNTKRPPTNELAVRQALHHAINKDAIIRVVFHGQSKPAWSVLQPPTPGYVPAARDLFPYDPERAKKILDAAGWKPGGDGIRAKDGKRLEILWIFGTQNGYEEMAPLIQAMAREVGIDLQLRERPRAQMEEMYRRGEHNIGEINWWFPDPSILSTNFHSTQISSYNRAHLTDAEIDRLMDQAATIGDETARFEAYKKIVPMIIRQVAHIPLVDQVTIVGTRKEVKDYGFNVVTFPVLYDVYLQK